MIFSKILPDCYRDSVFLMRLANGLKKLPGIEDAVLMVGSDANKSTLLKSGFLAPEIDTARPTDLIIAVRAAQPEPAESAFGLALDGLEGKHLSSPASQSQAYLSLELALQDHPQANLAIISVPGQYAAGEARRALHKGLQVLLFSDNVPVAEEVELKAEAAQRDLLVMGPDCGTAIIDGAPLAFANRISRGSVGIVGAAGTGIQEVTRLLSQGGIGVSQAIGTGGRDLKEAVGGLTMRQGINMLDRDPGTDLIVVVSKPPAPKVAQEIAAHLQACTKPAVVCFLGYHAPEQGQNIEYVSLLEDVLPAVGCILAGRQPEPRPDFWMATEALGRLLQSERARLSPQQRFIKGYFSGGTLCDEAQLILKEQLGQISSNIAISEADQLADPLAGQGHTVIDLGDDEFTRGRPHPMIDPGLRNSLIEKELANPTTAVILLDMVLGYGSHPHPEEDLVSVIKAARAAGRNTPVVCTVCGVEADPQDGRVVSAALAGAGVVVMPTNAQAARFAALLVQPDFPLSRVSCRELQPPASSKVSGLSQLLPGSPCIINIGVEDFYNDLVRNGVESYHVRWKPVAGGNQELADILSQIL